MVYFRSDNIISSLGFSTKETFSSIFNGDIGIRQVEDSSIYHEPFPASMIDLNRLNSEFEILANKYSNTKEYTKLEKMLLLSIEEALRKSGVNIKSKRTGIIISTTKGNIDLLETNNFPKDRVMLWKLGDVISDFFDNPNKAIIISNACISGVLAINTAAMYINSGRFDNMIVTGADIVSRFVVSGFMSFLSLSPTACKPFDKTRDGLSLGEAAATLILSNKRENNEHNIVHRGGASANDANHISGPSRTGEGSFIAIDKAIKESGLNYNEIDHISAHGTATPFNDEMESIAIHRHGMDKVPVNSIKGYLGHTLGAAGVVETAILLEEMRRNTMIATEGYNEHGVTNDINVLSKNTSQNLNTCLKMASGFGGSNAAMIVSKSSK